jgi:hypothetical protein
MGSEASTLGKELDQHLSIAPDIWYSEWHMLKLAEVNKTNGDINEKEMEEDTNITRKKIGKGSSMKIKYDDMVLYENDIDVINMYDTEDVFWSFLSDSTGLVEIESNKKALIYAVVVRSHIFFFEKKSDYIDALQAEKPPPPPFGIDIYSENLKVDILDNSFILSRLDESGKIEHLCEIVDITLGKCIAEVSTRHPEDRHSQQPRFLFNSTYIAPADNDNDVPAESQEMIECDEDKGNHFGDLIHQNDISDEDTSKIYKKGPLIFKKKKVFCSLGFGMILIYKSEENLADIHVKPWQVIDLHHASFNRDTHGSIEDEFGLLRCITRFEDEPLDERVDNSTKQNAGKIEEEEDHDERDHIDVKKIVIYVNNDKKYHRSRKYTLEAETNEDALQWYKNIELMLDCINNEENYDNVVNHIHISELVKHCRTGDLLLMKGKKLSCRIIRSFTRSEYDHVAMLYNLKANKYFFDSTGDGVCMHPLLKFINRKWYKPYRKTVFRRLHFIKIEEGKDPAVQVDYYKNKFELLDRGKLNVKREDIMPQSTLKAFTDFASNNIGKSYNLSMKKVRQATGREQSDVGNVESKEGMFCSELIASSYIHSKLLPPSDVHAPAYYYPGSFSEKRNLPLETLDIDGEKYIVKLGQEFIVDWENHDNCSDGKTTSNASSCLGR